MDRQEFHLRSGHIAQLYVMSNDGSKPYFDNIQLEHLLSKFVKREELDGTVVKRGTTLTNFTRARDLTRMALCFGK